MLVEALGAGRQETDRIALGAGGLDVEPARGGSGDDDIRIGAVEVDHRRYAGFRQRGEQPELGGEVILDGGVVIEVVAPEIGVAHRREIDAVEAALLDPVRGGLHGEIGDAVVGEPRQGRVQGDRIGGRQRAVGGAPVRDDAHRAEARGVRAETRQDLAHEIRDRTLAAGARDGDHLRGLAAGESPRRQGEASADIRDPEIGHGRIEIGRTRTFGDHGHGTGRRRLGGELAAVRDGPRNRDEHDAGAGLSRIRRQAGDGQIRESRIGLRKQPAQGGGPHRPSTCVAW